MKPAALLFLVTISTGEVFAAEARNFTKTLMEGVQKDIKNDNDVAFRKNNAPMRGPASVETGDQEAVGPDIQEKNKIDKSFRQIGADKW